MSDEILDSPQFVTAVQRPLGDPEIAVELLKLRVAELEQAIRRLADQDATLSVQGGNVIVEMDATLTAEEREAIAGVLTGRDHLVIHDVWKDEWKQNCDTLRGLLERTK